MLLTGGNFLSPSQETLLAWGASNSINLAHGEFWRLLTANFVHFGIIHLWFNGFALKILGPQIERLLGRNLFIITYLSSGIFAFLLSSFFHLGTAAGASGAIFGLIGVGAVFERLNPKASFLENLNHAKSFRLGILSFLRTRPFLSLALINILFASAVNLMTSLLSIRVKIDHAAHLGGMFWGFLFVQSLIFISSKKKKRARSTGIILILFLLVLSGGLVRTLFFTNYLEDKYLTRAESSKELIDSYYYYTEALKIRPENQEALFQRASLALIYGDRGTALRDFERLLSRGFSVSKFKSLQKDLKNLGRTEDIKLIDTFLKQKQSIYPPLKAR